MAEQPNRLSTVEHIDEGNITIITPAKYCKEGHKSFTFNKVFGPSATQGKVCNLESADQDLFSIFIFVTSIQYCFFFAL